MPTGIAEPPWRTPAECYLDQLASDHDWSVGSFETSTVELDTAAIVAAVADALLAVGTPPLDSPVITASRTGCALSRVVRHTSISP
ncbi:MAG TPA: hypothetical protein VGF32_13170 [Streptosporangiaceae bacterium]